MGAKSRGGGPLFSLHGRRSFYPSLSISRVVASLEVRRGEETRSPVASRTVQHNSHQVEWWYYAAACFCKLGGPLSKVANFEELPLKSARERDKLSLDCCPFYTSAHTLSDDLLGMFAFRSFARAGEGIFIQLSWFYLQKVSLPGESGGGESTQVPDPEKDEGREW